MGITPGPRFSWPGVMSISLIPSLNISLKSLYPLRFTKRQYYLYIYAKAVKMLVLNS